MNLFSPKMTTFYTTTQVAEMCGVSFRTVIRWADKGYLKAQVLPGRGDRRFLKEDVIAFLEHQKFHVPEELKKKKKFPFYSMDRKPRILIVEDEIEVAKSIQRVLRRKKMITEIAADGFQAGIFLHSFEPDLITLDLRMPNVNGFEVLKVIRNQEKYKELKILLVTAEIQDRIDEALKLGANDFVSKPCANELLLEKINKLLSNS
ncbi:MAG: response regulator [Bdellovibrionaceae bacterium]|nr:response regulator [Pseudobdellovibrionaceae bacterium]|tara:strand:+ start:401 stop:1015 length:615 start_codon:yes stop_codon:yes gene_type:complete